MFARARILLTIGVCAVALPATAQAPASAATFDGRYIGVSRESAKAGSNPGAKCPPSGVPAPLMIKNGVVGKPGTEGWEGTVSPQGVVTLRNGGSMRVDGQIDAQGGITAKYSGPACIITYVWRKQSG
jgi:hypothetical protein